MRFFPNLSQNTSSQKIKQGIEQLTEDWTRLWEFEMYFWVVRMTNTPVSALWSPVTGQQSERSPGSGLQAALRLLQPEFLQCVQF